jgi:hypothetical protein
LATYKLENRSRNAIKPSLDMVLNTNLDIRLKLMKAEKAPPISVAIV